MVINNYSTDAKIARWEHLVVTSPLSKRQSRKSVREFRPKPYKEKAKSSDEISKEENFVIDSVPATLHAYTRRKPLNGVYEPLMDKNCSSFVMSPARKFRNQFEHSSEYDISMYSLPSTRCPTRGSGRSMGSLASVSSGNSLASRGILPNVKKAELKVKEANYHTAVIRDLNQVRWWKPSTFLIPNYDALNDKHSKSYFHKDQVQRLIRETRNIAIN